MARNTARATRFGPPAAAGLPRSRPQDGTANLPRRAAEILLAHSHTGRGQRRSGDGAAHHDLPRPLDEADRGGVMKVRACGTEATHEHPDVEAPTERLRQLVITLGVEDL